MISDDMLTLMAAGGLGTAGTDLIAGGMPASPDVVTVVTHTGGLRPSHVFSQALPAIEYPRIQVRARGEADDYEAPMLQIERVYQFFVARGAETVSGGARYMRWDPIQLPFPLGQDTNRRWVFAVNFEVWKEVSAI